MPNKTKTICFDTKFQLTNKKAAKKVVL